MPLDTLHQIDNIVAHIDLVRRAGLKLGKKFIEEGQIEFGRLLIARVHCHDVSKFYGIEWQLLHRGPDMPSDLTMLAVNNHRLTNTHHPEYWNGVENMPPIDIAEMVCDWYARAQEFGTSLRDWIKTDAYERYKLYNISVQAGLIGKYVDMLTEVPFVKTT